MWEVLDTGVKTARENMEEDALLLERLQEGSAPILHLYSWKNPSITYGLFLKPETCLNLEALKNRGIDIAKRPTGGGVTFHLWDLAFSVLVPASYPLFSKNPLTNYKWINKKVLDAIREFLGDKKPALFQDTLDGNVPTVDTFCMAKPTRYDVMLGPLKVAGAAERQKKRGFLHQGSIFLKAPDRSLLKDVLLEKNALQAMDHYAHFLSVVKPLEKAREEMTHLLKKHFTKE